MEISTSSATAFAAPSINAVADSTGTSIPNPGTTQDTQLTLSGAGSANGVVVVLDNASPIGSASVLLTGTWVKSVAAAPGAHSFTVRASDGALSAAWVITVGSAAVKPTIVSIVDSKGVPIPPESSTSDTSVALSGTAEPGSTVEIKDGATPWGTALATGGAWTKELAGLPLGLRSMTAVTGGEASDSWRFTIGNADVQPTITSVRDSEGEVVDGGVTGDTSVTLAGKATASEQVQIFDGSTSKGMVPTNASGDWTLQLTALTIASHSITAKGLYGSQPVSAARVFRVAQDVWTEDFESVAEQIIPHGGNLDISSMRILFQRDPEGGTGVVKIESNSVLPGHSLVIQSDPGPRILVTLSVKTCSKVRFEYFRSSEAQNVEIKILNDDFQDVGNITLSKGRDFVEFSSGTNIGILHMYIVGDLLLDNFRFEK